MKWMLTKDENDQRPFMVILDEFITGTTEQEGHAQRTAQNVSAFPFDCIPNTPVYIL